MRRQRRTRESAPEPTNPATGAGREARRRASRRDRRGRGLRGPLAPAGVPLSATPAERFDDLLLDVVEGLEGRHPDRVRDVEFAVEDVPSLRDWDRDWVPLARSYPAIGSSPARLVVYRRAVEGRVEGRRELEDLVHDVVVEELAELLGIDPEELDPDLGDD